MHYNILHSDPPPPSRVNPVLPTRLDDVLLRALKKTQGDRFETCGVFVAALDRTLLGSSDAEAAEATRRTRPPAGRRSRMLKAVLAALICLAVLGGLADWIRIRLMDRRAEPKALVAAKANADQNGPSTGRSDSAPIAGHGTQETGTAPPIHAPSFVPDESASRLPERASARPVTPAAPEAGASKTDHPLDAAAGPHVTIPRPDVPLPQAKLNNSADVPANLLNSPNDSGSIAGSLNGPAGGATNGPATSESSVKGGGSNPEVGARSGTAASRGEPSVSAVIGPARILPWWVDPETGLMWSLRDNGTDVTWDQALTYCTNLSSGGLSDWRFPEISELAGIYDPVKERHTKGGIQLSQWWVWSGTTSFSKHAFRDGYLHGLTLGAYRPGTQKALYFLFAGGTQGEFSLDTKRNLRALCVRDGGK